jgi:hypothetical protein
MSEAPAPVRTYRAIDLADCGGLWRGLRAASANVEDLAARLPPDGLVTTPGFWFGAGPAGPGEHWLEAAPPGDGRTVEPPGKGERRVPVVRLDDGAAPGLRGGLSLEIGPRGARVGVAPEDWPRAMDPVLLAAAQCWRLLEVERRLDGLSAGVGARGASATLQDLMLDLSTSEGPLIDPRGYFATAEEASLYKTLARRAGLAAWRERVWERVEVVQDGVDAAGEARRHASALGWPLALEALILLAIGADLGWSVYSGLFAD